uniref:Uncharacterized protein n=1 Tax=Gorilla gorilla gorilla TaxID=9595 RepID=A0A2I2ZFY2_GORGO
MKLTHRMLLRSFCIANVFCENSDKINCFDFSPKSEVITLSSNDDSIVLSDCQEGKPKPCSVRSTVYTPAANTVVYSCNKIDDTIRYLSLHDNKYIRYFPGHSKRVVVLSMSPTIRLWDLQSPNCQGLMHIKGKPGPFATFKMQYDRTCEWTALKISNGGKFILISTNVSFIRLIGAFKGVVIHTFGSYANSKAVTLEASFTADSQFVMISSEDGKIHVWNGESGIKVAVLDGKHTGPITCLQFNPKFVTFASGCTNMAFWLPTIDD